MALASGMANGAGVSRVISRVRVTPRELKGYLLAASIMA
jgi:hypothetical protein